MQKQLWKQRKKDQRLPHKLERSPQRSSDSLKLPERERYIRTAKQTVRMFKKTKTTNQALTTSKKAQNDFNKGNTTQLNKSPSESRRPEYQFNRI